MQKLKSETDLFIIQNARVPQDRHHNTITHNNTQQHNTQHSVTVGVSVCSTGNAQPKRLKKEYYK